MKFQTKTTLEVRNDRYKTIDEFSELDYVKVEYVDVRDNNKFKSCIGIISIYNNKIRVMPEGSETVVILLSNIKNIERMF